MILYQELQNNMKVCIKIQKYETRTICSHSTSIYTLCYGIFLTSLQLQMALETILIRLNVASKYLVLRTLNLLSRFNLSLHSFLYLTLCFYPHVYPGSVSYSGVLSTNC